jgi:hypothetical protein
MVMVWVWLKYAPKGLCVQSLISNVVVLGDGRTFQRRGSVEWGYRSALN